MTIWYPRIDRLVPSPRVYWPKKVQAYQFSAMNLAGDGVDKLNRQRRLGLIDSSNHNCVRVEVLVADATIGQNTTNGGDRVMSGRLSNFDNLLAREELELPDLFLRNLVVPLDKLDALKSFSLTSDDNSLTGSEASRNRSNLTISTDREQPVAGRAIDDHSAGHTRKRSSGHHFNNVASVALDGDIFTLGSAQSNNTLILGVHTLDIKGLARNLGKDRLVPDNLALVFGAETIHTTAASCEHNELVEAKGVPVQTLLLADSRLATKHTGDEALRVCVSLFLQDLGKVLSTRDVGPDSSNSTAQALRTLPVNFAVADQNPVIRLGDSSSSNGEALGPRLLEDLSNGMDSLDITGRLDGPAGQNSMRLR
ncbi:hypothetical protein HG530_008304 [Fusarium avenaceum]|nr:hypothetical protein HG530_008304 [Fusarium avenaceum]